MFNHAGCRGGFLTSIPFGQSRYSCRYLGWHLQSHRCCSGDEWDGAAGRKCRLASCGGSSTVLFLHHADIFRAGHIPDVRRHPRGPLAAALRPWNAQWTRRLSPCARALPALALRAERMKRDRPILTPVCLSGTRPSRFYRYNSPPRRRYPQQSMRQGVPHQPTRDVPLPLPCPQPTLAAPQYTRLFRSRDNWLRDSTEARRTSKPASLQSTTTVAPTLTRVYRSITSSLVSRMQPEEIARPMYSGWLVPWMR